MSLRAARLATATALALAAAGVRSAAAQDSTAARRDTVAAAASDTTPADTAARHRHYVRPGSALVRSLLIPGWGQIALHRPITAGFFAAAEAGLLTVALKKNADLKRLRAAGDSVGADRKSREREDFFVYLGLNHVLAGLEAFVSANLQDFPQDLQLRAIPRGAAISVPFRLR